jgi:hypothetical protein
MTCSHDGCGCEPKKHTYSSLKYCDAHRKYDLCGHKSGYSHGKHGCGDKCEDKCECKCDKKKGCPCDEKIAFDCDDLAKTVVTKTVYCSTDISLSTVTQGFQVELTPEVKKCKVVGFSWIASNNDGMGSAAGDSVEVKSVTVKTCDGCWKLSECELGASPSTAGSYSLPKKCKCKPVHEIQCVEFCLVKNP